MRERNEKVAIHVESQKGKRLKNEEIERYLSVASARSIVSRSVAPTITRCNGNAAFLNQILDNLKMALIQDEQELRMK